MPETIASLIRVATQRLSAHDSARLDAEILLLNVIKKNRSHLYSHQEETLSQTQRQRYLEVIEQRAKGVPVAYLTGHKEFWSMEFQVTQDTLIPRPETELLVESILRLVDNDVCINLLDLGTGTGAIAIALAKELPKAEITAVDKSAAALDIAKSNAQSHAINNIHFIHSDWFNAIEQQYDLIVSNPPYISQTDPHLTTGDIRFEPQSALISGNNGLDDLKYIIQHGKSFLKEAGYLILEHGYQQGEAVEHLLRDSEYESIQALHDLAGHHRASVARNKRLTV